MNSRIVLTLIVLLTSPTACTEGEQTASADVNPEKTAVAAESRITAALEALRQRSMAEDDCYVIIEDRETDKLVQFIGSKTEPLMLDLPFQALSPREAERAREFFADFGISASEDGGYLMDLGWDVTRASEVTLRIFREVYQVQGDLNLVLTEE